MIVLHVPSRFLQIDEATASILAQVLRKCVPLEPIGYDPDKGFTLVDSTREFPFMKLFPDTHIQVAPTESPDVF